MAPLADTLRSRPWQLTAAGLLLAVGVGFFGVIADMVDVWAKYADYSHGFLVPPFAVYLLWSRRHLLPQTVRWPDSLGLLPLFLGIGLAVAAGLTNKAKEFAQGFGLILALAGVLVLVLGRGSLKWAWPALAFLPLMLKMPDKIEVEFLMKLRLIAARGSNFVLQTLGFPSYIPGDRGTTINIDVGDREIRLGVEQACSGLSMVLAFVAVAAAIAVLIKRPLGDRLLVFASALPIAVLCNVIRITVTSLFHIAGWKGLADAIVHDLAGWLMMPLALGFIALELKLVTWLFPPPAAAVDRDSVLKTAAKTATASWIVKKTDEPVPPPAEGGAR